MSFVGKGDPLRGAREDIREEVPRDERGWRLRRTGASEETMGPYYYDVVP